MPDAGSFSGRWHCIADSCVTSFTIWWSTCRALQNADRWYELEVISLMHQLARRLNRWDLQALASSLSSCHTGTSTAPGSKAHYSTYVLLHLPDGERLWKSLVVSLIDKAIWSTISMVGVPARLHAAAGHVRVIVYGAVSRLETLNRTKIQWAAAELWLRCPGPEWQNWGLAI